MISLIFPGQGSQAPGMGKFLFNEFRIAKDTFEEASEALHLDVKKLCFDSSEADLSLTENTQPALLCVSTATQRVVRQLTSLKVPAAAGHSIGEYAALVASGTMLFSDAIKAVKKRGQAMQSAVPRGEGGMFACLGLTDAQAQWLCQWTEKESGFKPLSPANYNSPGQIVISGSQKALSWLKDNFKPELIPDAPKRAKLIPLNVSAPFHCSLMAPAEEEMRSVLNAIKFTDAEFPIYQNFHAKAETKSDILKENLIRQISASVLWTQSMEAMKSKNLTTFIECGHGQVLKGLLKKIDDKFKVYGLNSIDDIKVLETDLKAMGH